MGEGQAIDPEERGSLEAYYERLTPQERRERILLVPAYRDHYNAITQAHRAVAQPLYFWERWVPVLGPVASVLYMKLRQYCYHAGAESPEEHCWPNQEALAREIGITSRVSIRDALRKLEALGFIRRDPTYRRDRETGLPHRATDAYCVFFELPLTTGDAIELLVRRSQEPPPGDPPYEVEIDPHRVEGQESLFPMRSKIDLISLVENRPHIAGRKSTSYRWSKIDPQVPNVTSNVNVNVCRNESDHIGPSLADELSEALQDPDSLPFYRHVVRRVPEGLIRIGLSETKGAQLEGRLEGRPGAYFTGAIKQLAKNAGIDL